jgi:hypothetical protein
MSSMDQSLLCLLGDARPSGGVEEALPASAIAPRCSSFSQIRSGFDGAVGSWTPSPMDAVSCGGSCAAVRCDAMKGWPSHPPRARILVDR